MDPTQTVLPKPANAVRPQMEYRRFGKTEERLSVITLGGMRFLHGWNPPREHLPKESINNCIETTRQALAAGINHIETAHGYMKSEHLYGIALRELAVPRTAYKIMTKGSPMSADETKTLVEEQLRALKLDHLDFYGWHGINNEERFQAALQRGGPVETLLRLKEQGVIRHVGFSTHGPLDLILRAIRTDLFEFVNLHYYYFFQRNWPAVQLAGEKDLGVFIISPNEKGGMLWSPSEKVRNLCQPLTAIQFNGRFCLSRPQIHTLSFGMHRPEHFTQNLAILNGGTYPTEEETRIKVRMDAPRIPSFCTYCSDCLPCPEDINIPEILRFRNLLLGHDMETYGKFRYNMLEGKGHWFPGHFASHCTDCGDCLPRCPERLDIPRLLKETHRNLFDSKSFLKNKLMAVAGSAFRFFKKITRSN
jgi:hypothetical protein